LIARCAVTIGVLAVMLPTSTMVAASLTPVVGIKEGDVVKPGLRALQDSPAAKPAAALQVSRACAQMATRGQCDVVEIDDLCPDECAALHGLASNSTGTAAGHTDVNQCAELARRGQCDLIANLCPAGTCAGSTRTNATSKGQTSSPIGHSIGGSSTLSGRVQTVSCLHEAASSSSSTAAALTTSRFATQHSRCIPA
jgi:hypothetical protein